jgi:aryl-alcohol dehydrogenase-like predicted oxidoreductase
VRAVGLSNHNAAQLAEAEALGHVDTLQPPFSAIKRETAAEILPWCHQHNTGVIVYSPMQAGLLTGAFNKARVADLPKNDWRSRNAEFTENLDRNLAVAAAMGQVAARHNVPTASVAVAWTLAWPGVTSAIVGARNPKQVDGWLPAAMLRLTAQDMSEIAAVIEEQGTGTGPASPSPVL